MRFIFASELYLIPELFLAPNLWQMNIYCSFRPNSYFNKVIYICPMKLIRMSIDLFVLLNHFINIYSLSTLLNQVFFPESVINQIKQLMWNAHCPQSNYVGLALVWKILQIVTYIIIFDLLIQNKTWFYFFFLYDWLTIYSLQGTLIYHVFVICIINLLHWLRVKS